MVDRAWVVALCLALAGCSQAADVEGPLAPDEGTLRGVVVDAAIRPVAGAEVRLPVLGTTTTTAEDGRFEVPDLPLGAVALTVSKPGFITATLTATVEAGEGRLVNVVLESAPDGSPFAVAYVFDGHIFCGTSHFAACAGPNAGLFILCQNTGVCGSNVTSDNFLAFHRLDGVPDHIQSELVWRNTQPLGDGMVMIHFASNEEELAQYGGRVQNETVGVSPLLSTLNASVIAESGLGVNSTLVIGVYGGPYGGEYPCAAGQCVENAGLVVEQDFRILTHAFYHYLPPAGWRFSTEGTVPPPA